MRSISRDTITLGPANLNRVKREDFPPSREDLCELNHEVSPDKVIPPVQAILRENGGAWAHGGNDTGLWEWCLIAV